MDPKLNFNVTCPSSLGSHTAIMSAHTYSFCLAAVGDGENVKRVRSFTSKIEKGCSKPADAVSAAERENCIEALEYT